MDPHIATEAGGGILTVRVAGRLASSGIAELRKACCESSLVRLDLSQLLTADEEGTRTLALMGDAGVERAGTPPFIDLLLRARSDYDPTALPKTNSKGEPA